MTTLRHVLVVDRDCKQLIFSKRRKNQSASEAKCDFLGTENHRMKMFLIYILSLISSILNFNSAEVFTSVEELKTFASNEKKAAKVLQEYIEKEKNDKVEK